MEAIEQYFPVVLYIILYNFHIDEILKCGHWKSLVSFIVLSKTVLQHFQFLIARTRWF